MASPAKTERGASVCDDFALRERRADGVHAIPLDSPEWAVWLRDPAHASFAFAGRLGSFTARRELRGGHAYWYAYRRRAGALRKVYLGRPEAVTRARLAAAAATLHAPAAAAKPAGTLAVASRPGTALPAALTSFVGREREMAEVRRLLGETRLLTLTGAGGVGKTRLALELARAVQADYPDGVWLVELAALADGALVPQTAARALGTPEQPGRPLTETLAAWLRERSLLMVLDNCEHLVDACAALAEALLRACPDVRVLAASREALGVAGELAWRVPSLAAPDLQALPATDELGRYAAIRLFVERAGFARPGFVLTAANAAAVAAVCRRLDGIPLALELAAARVAALSVAQIAARLDDCCRLLTGGDRAALPRQRTLRATLDWSHDLLDPADRALFRRLAVFAGGWTLAAAEAVGAGESVAREEVLDGLARLVAKSLAQMEERDQEARYRLLETVRQYAAERLAEAGEEDAARDRHAAWCLTLAERAEPELWGDAHARWLDRLEAEHDNLRTGLARCAERDPAAGLRLASLLYPFWKMHVHPTEGRRWLELLLALAPDRDATRCWALIGAAGLARFQGTFAGDLAAARAWGEEGLALGRQLGDRQLISDALGELGAVYVLQGDHQRAGELLAEGEALSRTAGFRRGLGVSLFYLGQLAVTQGDYRRARALMEESLAQGPAVGALYQAGIALFQLSRVALCQGDVERAEALGEASLAQARRAGGLATATMALRALGQVAAWQGDLERAARRYEESLDLARSVDYAAGVAPALAGLGRVALHRGEPARALAWLEESLARSRASGSKAGSGAALHGLGLAAWSLGDAERAGAHLRESLALRRETGDRLGVAECLEGLAPVAAGTGQPARAARLLGAAEALREAIGAPAPPLERPSHEQAARAARDALSAASFATAWAAGRTMALEQAIDEALSDDVARPSEPVPVAQARAAPPAADGLTPREVEVLRLLAAGRSNRQMAAELSVSARTIERHIGNLYTKIDAHNRADATAYAFRRGLL